MDCHEKVNTKKFLKKRPVSQTSAFFFGAKGRVVNNQQGAMSCEQRA